MITITTVGYGDFAPLIIESKIVIMFLAVWGGFLISLILLIITNVFQLDKN